MTLNTDLMRSQMKGLGIGNKELSKKSGVPLRTVNNILGGVTTNPTIDNLIALTKALDLTVNDVVGESEPETIAAHHDGSYWTDEELQEIETFKQYVLSKRK